jgi:hypothetical protein
VKLILAVGMIVLVILILVLARLIVIVKMRDVVAILSVLVTQIYVPVMNIVFVMEISMQHAFVRISADAREFVLAMPIILVVARVNVVVT